MGFFDINGQNLALCPAIANSKHDQTFKTIKIIFRYYLISELYIKSIMLHILNYKYVGMCNFKNLLYGISPISFFTKVDNKQGNTRLLKNWG